MFSTQAGQQPSCQTSNLIEQRNLSGYTGAPALSGFFQDLHVARGSGVSTSTVSRAPRRSHESGYYPRRAAQAHRRALAQQQNVSPLICAKTNQRSAARALQSYLRQVRGAHVSEPTSKEWDNGPASSSGTFCHSSVWLASPENTRLSRLPPAPCSL